MQVIYGFLCDNKLDAANNFRANLNSTSMPFITLSLSVVCLHKNEGVAQLSQGLVSHQQAVTAQL